jgi:hypothetical protein
MVFSGSGGMENQEDNAQAGHRKLYSPLDLDTEADGIV